MDDHYKILDVDRDCDQDTIKRAYRDLAKKYHPDKNKNKGLSDEKMSGIQDRYMKMHKAYEVLSDPELRAEYDRSGISAGKGDTIIDPLQAMIQMMEGKNQTGVPDVIVSVDCNIRDLYGGFVKTMEIERITVCGSCKGYGTKDKKQANCSNCKGRGVILERIEGGEAGYAYRESICDVCRGTSIDPDVKKCKECNGSRYDMETIDRDVTIPRGAYEGYFIKFDREGNFIPEENRTDPTIKRTDVIFVIGDVDYDIWSEKKRYRKKNIIYPVYGRGVVIKELNRADRADLIVTINIDFAESICGIRRKIMHIDDSILEISLNESVVNGDIIIIHGRGMPVVSDEMENRKKKGIDSTYGDLLIRFNTTRPKFDKGAKRKLWQIMTGTPHQNHTEYRNPESYNFLDQMIADQMITDQMIADQMIADQMIADVCVNDTHHSESESGD